MKNKQIVIIIAFIFIGIFIMFAVQQLQTSATLTKEQLTTQVEKVYQGSVQSFIEKDDYYIVSFEKNGSTYEVQIDPYNGELSNMQAIFIADKTSVAVKEEDSATSKGNERPEDKVEADYVAESDTQANPVVPTKPSDATNTNSKPTNIQKEAPPNPTKPLLSEAQAKAIALKEIKGEVESVDYKETSDGGHYIIEIELENDDKDEAYVKVHAVTGKFLSIQYED